MPINLTVYGQTDIGCVRTTNEDTFVIADLTGNNLIEGNPISRFEIGQHGVLLAVSDGMGGHAAGEVASALVVQSLQRAMSSAPETAPDALLERAVEKANRDVWDASHAKSRANMGATVTALFVHGTTAYIAEVGDSRAYLLRGGKLVQVTHDQSYVQLMVDQGALTLEEAGHSPFKNVIVQSMGQKPDVKVALGKLDLRYHDCFVICSDGLTNEVTPDQIRDVILSAPRLDTACARLIDLAKTHGGQDNVTVIIGGVSGDLPPLVPGEDVGETLEILKDFTIPKPT